MRHVIMAMTMAVTLMTGELRAAENKPLRADVGPGRVAWFDLATPNLTLSKQFYAKLFDWSFTPVVGTELAVEITSGGTPIGTLRAAEGKVSPYNGVVYVQVADIQASCKKAKELGGKIPPGFPFDLPAGNGAVALVVDPAGHPVGLYSRTPLAPRPAPTR